MQSISDQAGNQSLIAWMIFRIAESGAFGCALADTGQYGACTETERAGAARTPGSGANPRSRTIIEHLKMRSIQENQMINVIA
jgi:hypothetical protein